MLPSTVPALCVCLDATQEDEPYCCTSSRMTTPPHARGDVPLSATTPVHYGRWPTASLTATTRRRGYSRRGCEWLLLTTVRPMLLVAGLLMAMTMSGLICKVAAVQFSAMLGGYAAATLVEGASSPARHCIVVPIALPAATGSGGGRSPGPRPGRG